MIEHPILFSAPMVRAILEGKKTQTRRVVSFESGLAHQRAQLIRVGRSRDGTRVVATFGDSIPDDPVPLFVQCPYGAPSDRLWVKETIRRLRDDDGDFCDELSAYAADETLTVADSWPWQRPQLNSIHCPRGLSRITLEVTAVRVERLQDISEEDAKSEGVERIPGAGGAVYPSGQAYRRPSSYRQSFQRLWDSINGKRAPWASNPWVWALTFRKVD